jgi:hypothetical protein
MRKYPIAWFYILTFGISWLGMISIVCLVCRALFLKPTYRSSASHGLFAVPTLHF